MISLKPDNFGELFFALHGYKPFRWQQRLANQVATGEWPQALALPTASGKTACIDIALFALACQADWTSQKRLAPRRIFFVVDRRIIVDEAYARALYIRKALREPEQHVAELVEKLEANPISNAHSGKNSMIQCLQMMASALKHTGDSDEALVCCELRGGIYRDNAWAKTPTQPTVICSTVDQIGSRLLFRGYGLGRGTRVVHAGLAANDALIILDEAHCAKPFYQTGQAIRKYRSWGVPEHNLSSPFYFVVMSATPPAEIPADSVFPSIQSWSEDINHPDQELLANRVKASKPAQLVVAPKEPTRNSNLNLAKTLTKQALAQVSPEHHRIGIIVNRVATAKEIYHLLLSEQKDVVLLTGRMRGVDRDELLARWAPENVQDKVSGLLHWFGVDSNRPTIDHPIFVVATQCLEVGANLDFDVLVTECASLDALRQRFGRLNRGGRNIVARAVIVIRKDQVDPKEDDPVYGAALSATWKWLVENAQGNCVDFGFEQLDSLIPQLGEDRKELLSSLQMPTADAPVMLPSHIDCWVQTAPVPMPDPDPAIFLHGPSHGGPEVQLCWRADLTFTGNWEEAWIDTLSFCPPSSAECLPVPLYAVRSWLTDEATQLIELADVETVAAPIEAENNNVSLPAALVWRGSNESFRLQSPQQLKPGDTLILPVIEGRGEWNLFGHIPQFKGKPAIIDRGDETNFFTRGKAVLRLHPALMGDWPHQGSETAGAEAKLKLLELGQSEEPEEQAIEYQKTLRALINAHAIPSRLVEVVKQVAEARRPPKVYVYSRISSEGEGDGASDGVILITTGRFKYNPDLETFVNEDDSSSSTCEVELQDHLEGVTDFVRKFAIGNGLPVALIPDFGLAAGCHDLGKLDERFQAWLRAGDLIKARLSPIRLAKSGGLSSSASRRRAHKRSGYPQGARHELLSVRILEQAEGVLAKAYDRDLVLHLIGSHHGHCRPFAPIVIDESPVLVSANVQNHQISVQSATDLERLDSGVADRFWRLIRRYGWWGLAWLEAIFILGDHRRSEAEQRKEKD